MTDISFFGDFIIFFSFQDESASEMDGSDAVRTDAGLSDVRRLVGESSYQNEGELSEIAGILGQRQ